MHSLFLEENYLEAIYIVSLRKKDVRNVDITKEMKIAKSSVAAAIQRLVERGYITYEEDKIVRFTQSGLKIAKKIYRKHVFLVKILKHIGVDEETAEKEACKIEHIISDDSFEKINNYFKKEINKLNL
ncbi:transcriptional regulator [Clostridium novyi A str. 4552]|uniref:Transcriptional regulator n=1 Tax=Clostridium novyi A str. 4552 TaxID=1444289 RepID=A0A0A0I3N9_CLONO|nr:metal-dependent transcriptional regulator [Clostridium novyi]KGM94951.1 transcriptional regulator [Clostridium novyi A str. 4552]